MIAGWLWMVGKSPSATFGITGQDTLFSGGGFTKSERLSPESLQSIAKALQSPNSEVQKAIEELSRELGITKGALASFFSILGEKEVPIEYLPEKLAATARTLNEQREHAVRVTLEFAVNIAAELRKSLNLMMVIEDNPNIDRARANYINQTAALHDRVIYYQETLQRLISDYPDSLLQEQARHLTVELGQRQPARRHLINTVLHDIESRRTGRGVTKENLVIDIRRELCSGPQTQPFPEACRPFSHPQ